MNYAWQTGVTIADEPRNYNSDDAQAVYAHLKEIGVRWVALTPAAYIYTVNKPQLRWRVHSEIGDAIDSIHTRGLAVTLKPYLWSAQFYREGKWTGDIEMQSDSDGRRSFTNTTSSSCSTRTSPNSTVWIFVHRIGTAENTAPHRRLERIDNTGSQPISRHDYVRLRGYRRGEGSTVRARWIS